MSIEIKPFGTTKQGKEARLFVLKNKNGFTVNISDYGATVTNIYAADKLGNFADVVHGYPDLAGYEVGDDYVGATVGRFANRIAGAKFDLGGKTYILNKNNGENQCHGGLKTYDKEIWKVEIIESENAVIMTHFSPDGDENYPGNLTISVRFTVTDDNELKIKYFAETDKETPVNFTNHSYFNLAGRNSGEVFEQTLWIDAESYLRTDEGLIPTGEMVPVSGTPFDFTTPKTIGKDFDLEKSNDMKIGKGYDHCFNLKGWKNCKAGGKLVKRAVATEPKSGRVLEMYTNMPCVQLYTANTLTNAHFYAFCLETQFMPDSMHHEGFTDCILRPGEPFDYETVYKFI